HRRADACRDSYLFAFSWPVRRHFPGWFNIAAGQQRQRESIRPKGHGARDSAAAQSGYPRCGSASGVNVAESVSGQQVGPEIAEEQQLARGDHLPTAICYTRGMAPIAYLECSKCGEHLSGAQPHTICPKDGGSLYVRYDLQALKGKFTRESL